MLVDVLTGASALCASRNGVEELAMGWGGGGDLLVDRRMCHIKLDMKILVITNANVNHYRPLTELPPTENNMTYLGSYFTSIIRSLNYLH